MKRSRFVMTLAAVLALVLSAGALAVDYVDGALIYTQSDGASTVEKYSGLDETVVVPAMLGDCPVTTIETGAFYWCNAKTVYLPETVTRVNTYAFRDDVEVIWYKGEYDPSPTATPEPTPSPTPEPEMSGTQPTPTIDPDATPTIEPTATATATVKATATATTKPTATATSSTSSGSSSSSSSSTYSSSADVDDTPDDQIEGDSGLYEDQEIDIEDETEGAAGAGSILAIGTPEDLLRYVKYAELALRAMAEIN